jgi:hypothetical protein
MPDLEAKNLASRLSAWCRDLARELDTSGDVSLKKLASILLRRTLQLALMFLAWELTTLQTQSTLLQWCLSAIHDAMFPN